MTDFRLTHPTRGTLEFRQAQQSEDQRESVADIAPELGVDRPPLVHITTQNRRRTLRGRVSAPRRAQNDPDTSDWEQALANYADVLESHCDEFQGFDADTYTFEDDVRDENLTAVYESLSWTRTQGSPYEFEFEVSALIGEGVMESRARDPRNPTVDTSMGVAAKCGGEDLPGMRQFRSERSVGFEPNAIFDKESAENNDIVANEGTQQRWVFEGTLTGTQSARASKDSALRDLQGTQQTLETRWPGYHVNGFVLNYNSDIEARFAGNRTHFSLTFIEGQRA
jgi:hypothetical protein